jgi:hypothetical protein
MKEKLLAASSCRNLTDSRYTQEKEMEIWRFQEKKVSLHGKNYKDWRTTEYGKRTETTAYGHTDILGNHRGRIPVCRQDGTHPQVDAQP